MKKSIILTIVVFVAFAAPSLAADLGGQLKLNVNNNEELVETMQWLKSKLDGFNTYADGCKWEYKFDYDGCNIKIYYSFGCKTRDDYNVNFNLKDISSISITDNPYNSNIHFISFYSHDSSKSIMVNNERNDHFFAFTNDNMNLATRIVKAFTHAAKLCGAKEEKF